MDTRIPAHRRGYRIGAFLAAAIMLWGCVGTSSEGQAMGQAHTNITATTGTKTDAMAITDIAIPAHWSGVEGFAARDDAAALAPHTLRRYRVAPSPAADLPASVVAQAEVARPLLDLPPARALQDVTAAAAARGVTLAALVQAMTAGKRSQPNHLLSLGATASGQAFMLARIASDQPQAAVDATLYCVDTQPDTRGHIAVISLGGVSPQKLIDIKDNIC